MRESKQSNIHIGIVSKSRPKNVKKIISLLDGLELHWYVGIGEKKIYEDEGATFVTEINGLCNARNAVLEDAFARDKYCVEISDDITKSEYVVTKKETMPVALEDVINDMYLSLKNSPYYLAGVAPTANPFFFNRNTHNITFIVGDFIMIKPCELVFDNKLRLKEDYDYSVQHIKKYGGVLRLNRYLLSFKHKTNAGGAVDVRTIEIENQCIAYLKEKHKGWFRNNSKRDGEILLNVKELK